LQSHNRLNEFIGNHTDSFGKGNWTVNTRLEIQNCGTTTYFPLNTLVMDLINALPGNISVNTVQRATIEEAVFYAVSATPSAGNGPMNSQSDTWRVFCGLRYASIEGLCFLCVVRAERI
jgi:hypothetical protein